MSHVFLYLFGTNVENGWRVSVCAPFYLSRDRFHFHSLIHTHPQNPILGRCYVKICRILISMVFDLSSAVARFVSVCNFFLSSLIHFIIMRYVSP